jgi:hypothetical protein
MEAAVLRAFEEAVVALGRQDPGLALSILAALVPTTPGLGPVFDAVVVAAAELESEGNIPEATWNALADALPAEVRGEVEAARG